MLRAQGGAHPEAQPQCLGCTPPARTQRSRFFLPSLLCKIKHPAKLLAHVGDPVILTGRMGFLTSMWEKPGPGRGGWDGRWCRCLNVSHK